MTETDSASPRPGVVSAAFYIVLVLGTVSLLAIPYSPDGLVQGPLFLIAALGIWRKHAWSAYGLALMTLVLTGLPIADQFLRGQQLEASKASPLLIVAVFSAVLVTLLFLAGQAMDRGYGYRGLGWPWVLAATIAGGFLVLFSLFMMPTGSMEKTLLPGDRVAVWKTHGAAPSRGEMVVHVYPVNRKDVFIKRVVAIPGDRVHFANKTLFVNGTAMTEPYVEHGTDYLDSYRDNFPADPNFPVYPGAREMLAKNVVNGEVVVPPGRYFVLGDNRDFSLDSRYWGFIEQSDIIGTPKFIYYSVPSGERSSSTASKLPILNVRWRRMFRKLA